MAGKDASKQFWKYHNAGILKKYKGKLQVGSLNTKPAEEPAPAPAPAPKPTPAPVSSAPVPAGKPAPPHEPYGDLVPYADPSWYQGVSFCVTSGNFKCAFYISVIFFANFLFFLVENSTALLTTTIRMLLCATKSDNGSRMRSNLMSSNGMKARRYRTMSTSRWPREVIWPDC